MIKDWRNDISEINNLLDLDPVQVLISFRHQYLASAKDMLDDESWNDMGLEACEVAEALQAAIEVQFFDQEELRC